VRGAPISDMGSSTLNLALAALATTTLLARAMAPMAREARNCLLLWLALRGTRPSQRPAVIQALPPLDQQPQPACGSLIANTADAPTSTRTESPAICLQGSPHAPAIRPRATIAPVETGAAPKCPATSRGHVC
jgi:hypothetical protein